MRGVSRLFWKLSTFLREFICSLIPHILINQTASDFNNSKYVVSFHYNMAQKKQYFQLCQIFLELMFFLIFSIALSCNFISYCSAPFFY